MSLKSTLRFPIKADQRGTLAVVTNDNEIITQAILDLLETRMGERKMLPTYGLPDVLFSVLDNTFAFRLAVFVEEQIRNYILAIETVKVEAGTLINGQFRSELSQPHQAAIKILWWKRGQAMPQELIYPTWRLLENADAG